MIDTQQTFLRDAQVNFAKAFGVVNVVSFAIVGLGSFWKNGTNRPVEQWNECAMAGSSEIGTTAENIRRSTCSATAPLK
jgi:hypothetical protein